MTEADFRSLVRDNKDKVFNTCLSLVKNFEDAEDLAQEVFIEIYRKMEQFENRSSLSTWIYRIAVNKSLEHLRKQKALKRNVDYASLDMEMKDSNMFYHPGVTLENKEKSAILFRAIDQLPSSQKVAFTLHKVEGLSHEEIGKILEKSKSSTESLIHRAKMNLREILKGYYEKA